MTGLSFYFSDFDKKYLQSLDQDVFRIGDHETESLKREISAFYQDANYSYYQNLDVSIDVYQTFGCEDLKKIIAVKSSQISKDSSLNIEEKNQKLINLADDLRKLSTQDTEINSDSLVINSADLKEMLNQAIREYARIIAGSIDKKIAVVDRDSENSIGMNEIMVVKKDQKIIGFLLYRLCDVFDHAILDDPRRLDSPERSSLLERVKQQTSAISQSQDVDESLQEFHKQFIGNDKFIYIAQAGVNEKHHRQGVLEMMVHGLTTYLQNHPQLQDQIQASRPVGITFISRSFNPSPDNIIKKIEKVLLTINETLRSELDPRIANEISDPCDYGYDPKKYRGCQKFDLSKLNKFLSYYLTNIKQASKQDSPTSLASLASSASSASSASLTPSILSVPLDPSLSSDPLPSPDHSASSTPSTPLASSKSNRAEMLSSSRHSSLS